MYETHPSHELKKLFAHKPYQGVAPDKAAFLFVGLDANYDAHIAARPIFSRICEYHNDGVAFWRNHGVHHPFLLPEYSGDGQLYHRSFARIGFCSHHANLVSFVELLHVPTVGRSKLVTSDLDESHLKILNVAIIDGQAEYVFISANVARLMHSTGAFPWLTKSPQKGESTLAVFYRQNNKTVYAHLHFSVYGKFELQKRKEASFMRSLLPQAG